MLYSLKILFIKLIPVIAPAVIKPENNAAPTPAVTISWPVKYKPLTGVLGFKNFCWKRFGLWSIP